MNGQASHCHPIKRLNRLSLSWPLLAGLLAGLLVQMVQAGLPTYDNTQQAVVPGNTGNIDATNFINNNTFTVNTASIYETTDTLNYTNNGTMTGLAGFRFDTLSGGARSMAASFYNPGTITCVSQLSQLIVNATNLVSPNLLDVGPNGLLQLTGQNLDLSYGTFTIGQGNLTVTQFGLSGAGDFGTDTNAEWDPSVNLTATSATNSQPNSFIASPSVSYFNTQGPVSNTVIRAIFLNDNSKTNFVSTKVYFDTSAVGGGFAHVEWDGIFTNTATGLVTTNYLYLSDDYVLGASTNVTLAANGIPSNFQFTEVGPDPTLNSPATPGFQSVYLPGTITNVYSYALIQLIPTSVPTGPTASNPSGALTNLPARTQITANQELNLAQATISGQNYLSLTCTNQFDGNVGAQIFSPYTDINLGVTNGLITVSNLLQSVIPNWDGSIQAWSTRWTTTDTNGNITDFRVLVVSSDLTPFVSPTIQNITLHGTNLVVSDQLNILSNFFADAKSLTLTTNGAGAGSPDGELNFENNNSLFANVLPNLLWLTNNGAITMGNAGNFGGPSPANYQTFLNNGLLFDQGTTIYASYFENGGSIQNGSGNFFLQSQSAVLTNGLITATGDIAITAGSLLASNVVVQAGRSLTLQATNLLTDGMPPNAVTNGNNWTVGASSLVGLNLPILPAAGDLLGTTISVVASASKNVVNTWAGADWGVSAIGYLNNVAVGRLILNAVSVPPHSLLTFTGAGAKNGLYVDALFLTNNAATLSAASRTATALSISPNMVIYYQQAYSNGVVVSGTIDGWNNNRLRWVNPGILAQTNIVVQPLSGGPPAGLNYTVKGVLLPNANSLTTNSSYQVIVQTATNLASPNWVNVYTGTPPFTFTSFGYTNNQQQFYRAKQGW